jgi:tetratricopeptide (TPR) repeat protein
MTEPAVHGVDQRRSCWLTIAPAVVLLVLAPDLGTLSVLATSRQRVETADDLFTRYDRHDFQGVSVELGRVVNWSVFAKEMEGRLGHWPREAGTAFALEAAASALAQSHFDEHVTPYKSGLELLEAACDRLRGSGAPDLFELRWDLASMALLEGTGPELPTLYLRHLQEHVLKRFPSSSEVSFVAAFAAEQQILSWLPYQGVEVAQPKNQNEVNARKAARSAMGLVIERFHALTADPTVGAQALLHEGAISVFREDFIPALPILADAEGRTGDPDEKYLAHFFSARALTALNRVDEATAEYERALEVRPRTQSAQMSLAALLFLEDRRSEAASLSTDVLKNPTLGGDPWAWYPYGDFRHLGKRVGAMREVLK